MMLFSGFVNAETPCIQDNAGQLEKMPALSGGRVRPLGLVAKERIKFITGKTSVGEMSALMSYCQASLSSTAFAEGTTLEIPIQVNHVKTREFLGIKPDDKFINFALAKTRLDEMRKYSQTLKDRGENSPYSKDLSAVAMRTAILGDIYDGNDWLVPIFHAEEGKTPGDAQWVPLASLLKIGSLDSATFIDKVSTELKKQYIAHHGDSYILELYYDKLHLFHWAILVVILGLAVSLVSSKLGLAISISIAALVIEISAITFRILISGRAPVTNMYETVMWAAVCALSIALILGAWKKERLFIMAGLLFNMACLFMMTFATDMLDPAIRPLVPVLRDNFWLSTHVTSVTLSYASFALSWVIANFCIFRTILGKTDLKELNHLSTLCYDAIKVGVVFLALGIILGGVWADYSWGRFWGWDPKETWSLIALMTYMGVLHARLAGWVKNNRFIPLVALCFMTIIMAWFGVNYVLATGLHSYGFSEGGTVFVVGLIATQFVLSGVYLLRATQYSAPAHESSPAQL